MGVRGSRPPVPSSGTTHVYAGTLNTMVIRSTFYPSFQIKNIIMLRVLTKRATSNKHGLK